MSGGLLLTEVQLCLAVKVRDCGSVEPFCVPLEAENHDVNQPTNHADVFQTAAESGSNLAWILSGLFNLPT